MMRVPIQLRYNDYDDRGHVNNAVYLTYFELGRMEAWRTLGEGHEPSFLVAEARVTYRSPAMLGDPLAVEVETSEIRTKAWVWRYRVVDARDDRLIADGETTQVMYDFVSRKSVPIPDALRAALARELGAGG
jgi:acyl-CoA thioester hydrolase